MPHDPSRGLTICLVGEARVVTVRAPAETAVAAAVGDGARYQEQGVQSHYGSRSDVHVVGSDGDDPPTIFGDCNEGCCTSNNNNNSTTISFHLDLNPETLNHRLFVQGV
jgi:hypothetical protein